ncbi:DUF4824 family protein [Pseudomonas sp. NCCP-436]|uniref:DUF4824 family protein n=1 Tax=Pseudomonas sp. NCCP-436 TaxID=2842481 RepID=UPI001C80D7D3|nr:DUF4824 family protein [Pseudomonas sp. NCCP-436]GIZ13143.1 DUF4824 domain-containing protein [Pseudomonas sp. NCCP-436]
MRRPLWLGLGLILLSNAVTLGGVWYNRSGEPLAQLQFSERELRRSYGWLRGGADDSVRLQLVWRHPHNVYDEAWLDDAKLIQLGFDPEHLERGASRPVWLVLELNGPAYHEHLDKARVRLSEAEAALALRPDEERLLQQRDQLRLELKREKEEASRLLVVDVGLDAEVLRRQWPDRRQHLLLPARLTPYVRGALPGYYARIDLDNDFISIPLPYRELLRDWRQPSGMLVDVSFGQRYEPWVTGVTQ